MDSMVQQILNVLDDKCKEEEVADDSIKSDSRTNERDSDDHYKTNRRRRSPITKIGRPKQRPKPRPGPIPRPRPGTGKKLRAFMRPQQGQRP